MRWRRASALAFVTVAALLPASPAGAEQKIRIDCSNVIDDPGTYVVRNSVNDCTAGVGIIRITSDDVTLDLGGNRIGGAGDPDCAAAILATGTLVNVRVRNGTVSGCTNGVEFADAVTRSSVSRIRAVSNASAGILVVDDAKITNNVASRNDRGIWVSEGNVVRNNLTSGNASEGIRSGSDNEITDNTSTGNDLWGITTSADSLVADNVIRGNVNGIFGGPRTKVRANVVEGNSGVAIQSTSQDVKVIANRVSGNGRGIDMNTSKATITNNTVTGNGGTGIKVTADSVVRDNIANGNAVGIELGPSNNLIVGNKANGNALDGIRAFSADDTTTIKRNVANDNGEEGIDATVDVNGTGTNKAKRNEASPQCNPADLCV